METTFGADVVRHWDGRVVVEGGDYKGAAGDGQRLKRTSSDPLVRWFEQAGCGHGHNTYLQLLGAKKVPCKTVSLTPLKTEAAGVD